MLRTRQSAALAVVARTRIGSFVISRNRLREISHLKHFWISVSLVDDSIHNIDLYVAGLDSNEKIGMGQ